jgi:hypothetical protein
VALLGLRVATWIGRFVGLADEAEGGLLLNVLRSDMLTE